MSMTFESLCGSIVVWGVGSLWDAYRDRIPLRPKALLDSHSTDPAVIRPIDYLPDPEDVLLVFSLESFGIIVKLAVEMGFERTNIHSITEFDDALPRVEFLERVEDLENSKLVIARLRGEIEFQGGLTVISNQHRSLIEVASGARLRIGSFALYENTRVIVKGTGSVSLGSGSNLFHGSQIYCNSSVSIGNGCTISWDVAIMDHDGDYEISEQRKDARRDVNVGDRVWIGHQSSVLKGVQIGSGSIVASHSLVNRNVEPCTLVGGVPATTLRTGIEWK